MYSITNEDMPYFSRSAGRHFLFFLQYSSLYVALLAGFAVTSSEIIKHLANLVAFLFIFICAFRFSMIRGSPNHFNLDGRVRHGLPGYRIALCIIFFGMVLNFIVNHKSADLSEFLKFLMAPFFFVIGVRSAENYHLGLVEKRAIRILIVFLIGIPLLVGIFDIFGNVGSSAVTDSLGSAPISIFSNRNNAALYAVVLGAALNAAGLSWRKVLVYLLLVALLSGTIGVLVSLLLSISLVFMRRRNIPLLTVIGVGIAALASFLPEFGVFKRITTLTEGIGAFIALGDSVSISSMNYSDFSSLSGGSSDISFFFRLQHWVDLLNKFLHKPTLNILFGNGVGSSALLSTAQLVPHNDYIRYLFECGILPLLGFILLNISLLVCIGRNYLVVPFLAVNIYFFSENLINNFLAMSMYYFMAGFTVKMLKNKHVSKKSPVVI